MCVRSGPPLTQLEWTSEGTQQMFHRGQQRLVSLRNRGACLLPYSRHSRVNDEMFERLGLASDGKRTFQDFNASCHWRERRHHARDITLPLLFNFISVRA